MGLKWFFEINVPVNKPSILMRNESCSFEQNRKRKHSQKPKMRLKNTAKA